MQYSFRVEPGLGLLSPVSGAPRQEMPAPRRDPKGFGDIYERAPQQARHRDDDAPRREQPPHSSQGAAASHNAKDRPDRPDRPQAPTQAGAAERSGRRDPEKAEAAAARADGSGDARAAEKRVSDDETAEACTSGQAAASAGQSTDEAAAAPVEDVAGGSGADAVEPEESAETASAAPSETTDGPDAETPQPEGVVIDRAALAGEGAGEGDGMSGGAATGAIQDGADQDGSAQNGADQAGGQDAADQAAAAIPAGPFPGLGWRDGAAAGPASGPSAARRAAPTGLVASQSGLPPGLQHADGLANAAPARGMGQPEDGESVPAEGLRASRSDAADPAAVAARAAQPVQTAIPPGPGQAALAAALRGSTGNSGMSPAGENAVQDGAEAAGAGDDAPPTSETPRGPRLEATGPSLHPARHPAADGAPSRYAARAQAADQPSVAPAPAAAATAGPGQGAAGAAAVAGMTAPPGLGSAAAPDPAQNAGEDALQRIELAQVSGSPVERAGPEGARIASQGPALADAPRPAMRSLAEALHRASDGKVEVTLNPEELGRVRLTLHSGDNAITVQVHADRGDTLDLMRRHADMLGSAMRELGYGDVVLDFGGQGQGRAPQQMAEAGANTLPAEESAAAPQPAQARQGIGAASGLDLRL